MINAIVVDRLLAASAAKATNNSLIKHLSTFGDHFEFCLPKEQAGKENNVIKGLTNFMQECELLIQKGPVLIFTYN